jgi:dienelactone hydrolase
MRPSRLLLVLACLLPHAAAAQAPFTLADTRKTGGVGSPTVSADGRTVAFVVSQANYVAKLIAAQGAIVFEPNCRGSDNLGNAFQSAITRDAGAGPGRDVMAGVRMLRATPFIDPSRTVVTGWSCGGCMTSWTIGNDPAEWTAAMAGAPVTDWEDQYNLADGNVNWGYLTGGSPWTVEGRSGSAASRATEPTSLASDAFPG